MSAGSASARKRRCTGVTGRGGGGRGAAASSRRTPASRKSAGEARRDIRPSVRHHLRVRMGGRMSDPVPGGWPAVRSGWATMTRTVRVLVAISVLLGLGALAAVAAEPLPSGSGARWAANMGWTLGGMVALCGTLAAGLRRERGSAVRGVWLPWTVGTACWVAGSLYRDIAATGVQSPPRRAAMALFRPLLHRLLRPQAAACPHFRDLPARRDSRRPAHRGRRTRRGSCTARHQHRE